MERHDHLLSRHRTGLVVIDIQERLAAVMFEHERLIDNTIKLIRGSKVLQIPTFLTEQYPRGLGPTVRAIQDALGSVTSYEKMAFSCCAAHPLVTELQARGVGQVVLAGIEAHVCILQSALDLAAVGFQVHVPYDAISSRRQSDYEVALSRLRQEGVTVTTTESVLFELLRVAGTAEFKEVSALIK